MLNPEQMKEYIKLNIKEILKENLEVVVHMNTATLDVEVRFDDEIITTGYIWGSDIKNIIGE